MSVWTTVDTKGDSPLPLENFASTLVYYPHYQTSSHKVYFHGGTGRFGYSPNVREVFEFNVPNTGGTYFAPSNFRTIETKAYDESNDVIHVPEQRWAHTLTWSSQLNSLIMYGGEYTVARLNDDKVFSLQLDTFTWQHHETASQTLLARTAQPIKPMPRAYHAAAASSSGKASLFIFGGYNNVLDETLGDLWRLDLDTMTWKLLSNFPAKKLNDKPTVTKAHPSPRYGHALFMSPQQDCLYLVGGTSTEDVPMKDFWKYDLEKNKWEQLTYDCSDEEGATDNKSIENPLHIPAANGASFMFGSSIVMVGGETKTTGADPILSDLLVYNTKSRKLARCNVKSTDIGLVNHAAFQVNGKIYVFGGRYNWPFFNSSMFCLDILKTPAVSKCLLSANFKVAGLSVAGLMKRAENAEEPYPAIFQVLIQYLLEKGLDAEGLFRVSPTGNELDTLRLKFEQGIPAKFVDMTKYPNAICVASFLKQVLRDGPEPLIPNEFNPSVLAVFADASKKDDDGVKDIAAIINKLPAANKNLLKALLDLMTKIIEHGNMNKMNSEALARTPAIGFIKLTPEEELKYIAAKDSPVVRFFRVMIENASKLQ